MASRPATAFYPVAYDTGDNIHKSVGETPFGSFHTHAVPHAVPDAAPPTTLAP